MHRPTQRGPYPDQVNRMNAHIIAFARNKIITTASLIDLRDARRLAIRTGDNHSASLFMGEIRRRMVD